VVVRREKIAMVRLRTGLEPDVPAITRLINAAFEVERFFLDHDRIDAAEVRERLGKGRFILAEDSTVAGCVYVELRGERGYIGLLSVDPSRQRSGLGSNLMAAAEEYARAAGCRFVDLLIVNLRLELPPFYRRLGYVEDGTSPFPAEANPQQPCHFIKMFKPLRDRNNTID
jgi:predicted N-acetyltransferase YhbS